jgi:hypothetical protein
LTGQTSPEVIVIARPGRDRRSLVALLKTLGRAELFLLHGAVSDEALAAQFGERPVRSPKLIVVDLDGLEDGGPHLLAWARRHWPGARRLALSDAPGRTAAPSGLDADCSLARNAPAGDLLHAARRMSAS